MFQKTTLVGRLGQDPNMRYTADGNPVTNISVAVDTGFGDHKTTLWWRCSFWGKQAETVNQFCKKGQLVLVEGEVQAPRPYQDREGQWRANLDLRGNNIRFLSSGNGKGQVEDDGSADAAKPAAGKATEKVMPDIDDTEIPF